ncbi:MAG: AAA family ATPase [Clostridiales bacterium]|nr:AAA family ATPase [Clostridiales bacterium]
MAIYLNTDAALENYKKLRKSTYFIDKSMILDKLNKLIDTSDCYVCITKPRRFGKSSIINMLGAYYTKGYNSKDIFDKLNISKSDSYLENLNKYNVIKLSFNEIPENKKTYDDYISNIINNLKEDLLNTFNNILVKSEDIYKMLNRTNEKFIFIIDEWDYIFSHDLFKENQKDFLEFLRNLLKDKPYVALCYMTGVLPIKKYSEGSALNMFREYTMLNDRVYSDYFGFTVEEVKDLCKRNGKMSFNEITEWYNGYLDCYGNSLYNPRSVVSALNDNYCQSYWTNTGRMDEVLFYLKYNIAEVRDDVIEMVSGNIVDIVIDEEFRAGQDAPETREEIYSAMIVYGFLSYYDGTIRIPNKELMKEFEKALKDKSFGEVMTMVKNSEKMLKATLNKDTKTMEKIINDIHNSEIPILQYNDENSLSCVITLAYLYARNKYRIEREEKTGKGYADFMFHPRRKNNAAFILELKKDSSPEVAMKQIIEKEYSQKFVKENIKSKILAVAICYDSKTKEHKCKVEEIN